MPFLYDSAPSPSPKLTPDLSVSQVSSTTRQYVRLHFKLPATMMSQFASTRCFTSAEPWSTVERMLLAESAESFLFIFMTSYPLHREQL